MKKEKKIKSDLTIEDMPHNRLQVFFDIIKVRWDILLYIGLILFLFFIPLIIALFTENIFVSNLYELFVKGNINEETYRINLFQTNLIFTLIESIAILLIALPLSGIIRIYRLLCFYEGIIFFRDLFKGIKDNIKQVVVVFIIDVLLFIATKLSINYLIASGNNDFINTFIFFLPAFLFGILILPISLLHILQVAIYNNKYFENVKNSFVLYFKSGFTSFGVTLLLFSPLFLFFINAIYTPIILLSLYALLFIPLAVLFAFLHANWIFDKYINKSQYPEIFDKGIYRNK